MALDAASVDPDEEEMLLVGLAMPESELLPLPAVVTEEVVQVALREIVGH